MASIKTCSAEGVDVSRVRGLWPGQLVTVCLAALLLVGFWAAPGGAQEECVCISCHGTLDQVHGDFGHAAAPGSGMVTIFADNQHDYAGWTGPQPYFAVQVDCTICHNTELREVHGNDCATCHPTPYDTLGIWGKGCQQGGCHAFYHQDSAKAHWPFENTSDPANNCDACHVTSVSGVDQSACLNCHAAYVSGDVTPPVTTSNVQAVYDGPATIAFSIMDNGKVGVGRTFYQLNGGPVTAAGKYLYIAEPGDYQLIFWSKDQSGNTEAAPNSFFFTIIGDNTPPVTTSNAQPQGIYYQGATITLTATDESTQGVKTTYYQLNDGAIQSGTTVVVPATNGTIEYTLTFWSEDWAGNVEAKQSVSFTVISGGGTIRLVWGYSDMTASPCPGDPEANASWVIRRGSWSGSIVASGSGGCPNWSGVNDVAVPVSSTTPYFVIVDWWESYDGYYDQSWFGNIYVTTPGQLVRIGY
jgi:hypothetical protein